LLKATTSNLRKEKKTCKQNLFLCLASMASLYCNILASQVTNIKHNNTNHKASYIATSCKLKRTMYTGL
jgi:hypothetical protein